MMRVKCIDYRWDPSLLGTPIKGDERTERGLEIGKVYDATAAYSTKDYSIEGLPFGYSKRRFILADPIDVLIEEVDT